MKCAYEPANGIEGHMVANMLQQQGIESRIDGEHLTSGVGELPAAGLVRVMVDEEDYDRARKIIVAWEKESPPAHPTPSQKSGALVWFMLGLGVGMLLMSWIANSLPH